MTFILLLPAILSLLALAAHFLRSEMTPVTVICLLAICLLAIRKQWTARVVQAILILGAIEWVRTLINLANQRIAADQPWMRMAIILGGVAAISIIAAIGFQTPPLRKRYR